MGKGVIKGINPYLPEYEYVPDGEPHVFGERVYIYGSHDRFNGTRYCMNDYICYSASIYDLTEWKYEGVIYKKSEDPRTGDGNHEYWAPDVVRGKDGRYYLYYCTDYYFKSVGVAVSDTPAGEFKYLGLLRDKNGGTIGERPGDYRVFDPGVFADDDGRIYLYYGNGDREKEYVNFVKDKKASLVTELADDMITIKREPVPIIPVIGYDTRDFKGHEFFEASSVRKINGMYYFVYSSVKSHELCFAISKNAVGPFYYGGVIISNGDIFGAETYEDAKTPIGNNHGSIEEINGKYYIFYHRQTNACEFSRQACAERIEILPDGSIPQVHITSEGLRGKAFSEPGTYPAYMACYINMNGKSCRSKKGMWNPDYPYFTQSGEDYDYGSDGVAPYQYITNFKNGARAYFKYFDIKETHKITITVRGNGRGVIYVKTDEKMCGNTEKVNEPKYPVKSYDAKIFLSSCDVFTEFSAEFKTNHKSEYPIIFEFFGEGTIDILEFGIE